MTTPPVPSTYFAGYRWFLPVLAGAVLLGEAWRVSQGEPIGRLGDGLLYFLALSMLGAFAVIAFAPSIPRREKYRVLFVGALVEAARGGYPIFHPESHWAGVTSVGAGLGAVAIALALWRLVAAPPGAARRSALDLLSAALFMPIALLSLDPTIEFVSKGVTRALDLQLYDFDLTLGIAPLTWLGQLTWVSHPWALAEIAFYAAMGSAAVAMAAAAERGGSSARGLPPLLLSFLIGGVIAAPLYRFAPAIGPIPTFGTAFPEALPILGAVAPAIFVPDPKYTVNTIPSMHMAWAIMGLWTGWQLSRPVRLAGILFCGGTVLVTLALGQHYVIDLVAAVPVALLARAFATPLPVMDRTRASVLAIAVALGAFWFVPLHVGWLWWRGPAAVSPLARAWLAIGVTIVVAVVAERALTRHALGITTAQWRWRLARSR